MDGEELGGTFVISVDELGVNGLWSTIKDLVESRVPLQGVTLPNKVGKPVAVPKLPLTFVLSTDKRLLRLKQYSHSPVTWFRNPVTHLVLVSTSDVHEYKSTLRAQLKRVTTDVERDWGGPGAGTEWLILYVRPFELEPGDKNARKVFEKLCDDFGAKRREQVVRLDVPLQAFDTPTGSGGSRTARLGGSSPADYGVVGQASAGSNWGLGASGLDELAAALRDSIRAAFEARQSAYDAEVRRLLNERRDPKWSFTTLYLVKDSFALMLEGAGLWEDAFQEYVELETVYLDCLESSNLAGGSKSAESAATDAAHFGLTLSDADDVASLLSSSWRAMRRLVLWKKQVQEFHFRQYLFAAQARVLLRLGRPIDVAERGLVFVQNFLAILAAREAAGQIRPWFKECWVFSACMSLISVITCCTQQMKQQGVHHADSFDVTDLLSSSSAPQGPAAQAAMRQLSAAVAAEKAAAAGAGTASASSVGSGVLSYKKTADNASDRTPRSRGSAPVSPQYAAAAPPTGTPAASAAAAGVQASNPSSMPVISAEGWELGVLWDPAADLAQGLGSPGSAGVGEEQDGPPLDLGLLCGQAITPASVGMLLQGQDQRRELMDRLYDCLLGHLYHLARGELLRVGAALRLPEAAAAASASILQLGNTPFATPASSGSSSSTVAGSLDAKSAASKPQAAAGGSSSSKGRVSTQLQHSGMAAGLDLLAAAAAAGTISPRMIAQLQEMLTMPVCGFSNMINKYADGVGVGLAYEVNTPKLGPDQDPLAAALARRDSQSTPYPTTPTNTAANNSMQSVATPTATPAANSSSAPSMLDRLRRGSSISSGSNGSSILASVGSQQQQQHGSAAAAAAVHSRLSKVTGDYDGGEGAFRHQDSSSSLATVNINAPGEGQSFDEHSSSSGAAVSAGSVAGGGDSPLKPYDDSASSLAAPAGAGGVHQLLSEGSAPASLVNSHTAVSGSAASMSAATGSDLSGLGLGDVAAPKVATHTRSASALPTTGGGSGTIGSGIAGGTGGILSPRRLEGLVDPGAIAAAPSKGTTTTTTSSSSSVLNRRTGGGPLLALLHPTAAAAAAAAVPGWVGEWRLQLALRSPACFQELVLALSRRAAWCYACAGRVRSSALIYGDVALLALQRGQLQQAARLLDRMQQIFASEGWQLLLGALLPKLLACQCLAAQPMLPFTAMSLLSLPYGAAAEADRQAAYEELMAAVGATAAETAAAAATAVAENALPRGVSTGDVQQVVQLATLSAVQLRPAPGTYSHFLGNEAPEVLEVNQQRPGPQVASLHHHQQQELVPMLSPPARPPSDAVTQHKTACRAVCGKQGGAVLLAVGDSLSLAVDVVSRLPGPVVLRRLTLSLVQLHKSTWYSSGGASFFAGAGTGHFAGLGNNAFMGTVGLGNDSTATAGTAAASEFSQQQQQQQGLGIKTSKQLFRTMLQASTQSDSPRIAVQRWQEGEELLGNRLLAAFRPEHWGTSSTSSNSNSSSDHLANSIPDSSQQPVGGSSNGSNSQLTCRMLGSNAVLVIPGVNRLVFQLAPVKEGLYCLKQLRALIGRSGELLMGLPPGGSLSLLAATSQFSTSSSQNSKHGPEIAALKCASVPSEASGLHSGNETVQIGEVSSTGNVKSEVIVARVRGPVPRFTVTPVVPDGCLPVGCTAWLGVLVTPLHDASLQQPRLHIQPNKLLAFVSQQQQAVERQGLDGIGFMGGTAQQLSGVTSWSGVAAGGAGVRSGGASSSMVQQQQQQAAHWVYMVPLQQGQQQQQAEGWLASQQQQQQQPWPPDPPILQQQQPAAAAGGAWCPVVRGAVDLSGLVEGQGGQQGLIDPILLWMQVLVGTPPVAAASVKVAALPAPTALPATATPPSVLPAAAPAAAIGQQKSLPEPSVLLASRPADAVAELALQLEYTAGVPRSHSRTLQLPLQQPARITATALQLPNGTVALNITLSLDTGLNTSLLVLEAGLRPQYGLMLQQGLAGGQVLPLRVVPGGSAGLCYVLSRDAGDKPTGSFEAGGASLLVLSYVLEPAGSSADSITDPLSQQLLPLPPAPMGAAAADEVAVQQPDSTYRPPSEAAAAAAAAGTVMSLRLPFWLEFPSQAQLAAAACIRATLLGPFRGRAGQPLMLTWQLMRTTCASLAADVAATLATKRHSGDSQLAVVNGFSSVDLQATAHATSSTPELPVQLNEASAEGLAGGASQRQQFYEVIVYEVVYSDDGAQPAGTAAKKADAAVRRSYQGSAGLGSEGFWLQGCASSGSVRLGRAPGSLATLEVVAVPQGVGCLPPPQLVLRSPGGNQPLLVENGVAGSVGASEQLIVVS